MARSKKGGHTRSTRKTSTSRRRRAKTSRARTKSRKPTRRRSQSVNAPRASAFTGSTSRAVDQSFTSDETSRTSSSTAWATAGQDAPWVAIRSYADLVYVNSAFVLGKLNRSPYHLGPLDEESASLVPDLVQLHLYGAVTVESQPALLMTEPIKSESRRGRFVEARQRPYLVFFMPNQPKYVEAINAMYNRPGIFAVSVTNVANNKWSANFNEPIVVTEERDAPSASAISKRKFRTYSSVKPDSSTREAKLFDKFPNITAVLQTTICVEIASVLPFGQGNIAKAVINAFNALQIQPSYNVAVQ